MAPRARSLLAWVVILFAALVAADFDPVVIKGSHFFYKTNGSEFFIRGVTYQPPSNTSDTQTDPLATLNCMRDINYLTQLTTNVIRVSYIDPTQDHTACMTALQNAGIYVFVDLPTNITINSTNPEWNLDIYNSWTGRIDAVAGFNNVLGFFAGNSIVTDSSTSPAAAFVKAAIRDLKSYINSKYNRAIPVGYELNADDNYDIVSSYMTCGGNATAAIDFLGISDFNLCSNNTSQAFDLISEEYAKYPVPVFFADYGCTDTTGSARTFDEVQRIYGNPFTNVISGGVVFEYFQDGNLGGLVSVAGTQVTPLAGFTSYSSQIAKITPSSTFASNYVVSNTFTPSCSTGASFSASPTLPPVVNQNVCSCMLGSLQCIAKPNLSTETVTTVLQSICGSTSENCPALHGNGGNGTYGAYSMCSTSERLSWALNEQYKYNSNGCSSDANAQIQDTFYIGGGTACADSLEQAGEAGTGTITSFPTATNSPGTASTYFPTVDAETTFYLSQGAIAGITIGALVFVAVIVLASFWCCCWRRGARRSCNGCCTRRQPRGRRVDVHDKAVDFDSESPVHADGLRGVGTSIISDDSRGMVELQPWDERYLPARNQEDVHSAEEAETQHAAPKLVSPVFQPSPNSSVKELPAFRANDQPEDKSLGSMKLLSPVVKVVPVQPNAN